MDEMRVKKAPKPKTWVNWLLIFIGVALLIGGSLYLPTRLGERLIPERVRQAITEANVSADLARSLGLAGGIQLMVYGIFSIIAGIGLFAQRGWAWGMAIMILSIIVVMTVADIAAAAMGGKFDPFLMGLPIIAAFASLCAWFALMGARKAYKA